MYNKLRLGIYVSSRLHLSATPSLLRFFTSLFPSFSSGGDEHADEEETEKGGDVERSR